MTFGLHFFTFIQLSPDAFEEVTPVRNFLRLLEEIHAEIKMQQYFRLSEIIFRPGTEVSVPNVAPHFPAVPSAYYYYQNRDGVRIPALNTVGSTEEQQHSLQIWYALNSDAIFPLKVSYAATRQDQAASKRGSAEVYPPSEISLSMKSQIRQFPDDSDVIFDDRFAIVTGMTKRMTSFDLLEDVYRFPLSPAANIFRAARLVDEYFSSGDPEGIDSYLRQRGVQHLYNHNWGYYPAYELFFLLTRFCSRPLTENQLRLMERRAQTVFGSPARTFIDAIFEYPTEDPVQVLQMIDSIQSQGPETVGALLGTDNSEWVRWANEYLKNANVPPTPVPNLADTLSPLTDRLYTWTDRQIDELAKKLQMTLPFPREYRSRYSWVASLAGSILLHRADPADTNLWELLTAQ